MFTFIQESWLIFMDLMKVLFLWGGHACERCTMVSGLRKCSTVIGSYYLQYLRYARGYVKHVRLKPDFI